ncbi:MAG: hypothetical protein WDW38_004070 [Sanguina aurantia]
MEEQECFICLQTGINLQPPCDCSKRFVHAECSARWQLQRAGSIEESVCRFCASALPKWQTVLTPVAAPRAQPTLAIICQGRLVRIKMDEHDPQTFQDAIRGIFNLPASTELDISFEARVPGSGDRIRLTGLGTYSAAMHCAQVSAGERAARRAQLVQDLLHLPPTAFPAIIARATVSESGTGSGSSSAGTERHHHRHPNFHSTAPTSNRSVTPVGAPAGAGHSWPETLINQMGDTYHDANDAEHGDHHGRGASQSPADGAEQGSVSHAEGVSFEQELEQQQQCWRTEESVLHAPDVPPSHSQSLGMGLISHFSLRIPSPSKSQEHHHRQQQQQQQQPGGIPSVQDLLASMEQQQQQQQQLEEGGAVEEERELLFSSTSGPTMSSSYATPATSSPAATPTLTPSSSLTCPAFRRLASGGDRREGGIMDSASSISHMSAGRSPDSEKCGNAAPSASVFGGDGMMGFGRESDPWAIMGLQGITQLVGSDPAPGSCACGGGGEAGGVGSLQRVDGGGSPRSVSFGSRFADAVMRRGLLREKRAGRGWVASVKHSLWGGGAHPQPS